MSTLLDTNLDDAVWRLDGRSPELWIVAVAFFGVGDVLTTFLGLTAGHLVEVGPLAGPVIDQFGLGALLVLKVAAFGFCYLLWRRTPSPSAVGVPLGLATFGVLVTGWNASLLLLVL